MKTNEEITKFMKQVHGMRFDIDKLMKFNECVNNALESDLPTIEWEGKTLDTELCMKLSIFVMQDFAKQLLGKKMKELGLIDKTEKPHFNLDLSKN